jgi:hypothetical protein
MGITQEANAWGGGIGLSEHPLDANPIGIIDWAIIDNIINAHTDWAGIYAAWRGGATTGVTLAGTWFSVNAPYRSSQSGNGIAKQYFQGVLTIGQPQAIGAGFDASRTSIVGHLGRWAYFGTETAGFGWPGGLSVRVSATIWELTGILTIFDFEGHLGLAFESQIMPARGERPLYYEWPSSTPHDWVNPYAYPYLGLGPEPLGMPISLDSQFLRWLLP